MIMGLWEVKFIHDAKNNSFSTINQLVNTLLTVVSHSLDKITLSDLTVYKYKDADLQMISYTKPVSRNTVLRADINHPTLTQKHSTGPTNYRTLKS